MLRIVSAQLKKLALIAIVFLLLFAGAFSFLPSQAKAQGGGTVTGVGPWTQQGNYGSSSTTPGGSGGVATLGASCVVYSGYAYCVGGQNPSGTDLSDVFYAQLSSGGSIGPWTETTDYGATTGTSGSGGTVIEWPSCVESGGYIYCVAGASPITSKVFYAQLSSTGVGPWTETTDYGSNSTSDGSGGQKVFQLSCVADSGYVYCVGDAGSKVYYAQLSSSGVGPWKETTDYGAATGSTGSGGVTIDSNVCVDSNATIYCIGGTSTGFAVVSDVFSAPLTSSGVGAWTENTDFGSNSTSNGTGGEPIYGTACVVYFSYVICVGGDTTGNVGTAHVFIGQDGEIIGWFKTADGPVATYWDDCFGFEGYLYCLGQSVRWVYSALIDTTSSTTSTSTTSTTSTSTTTTSTTTTPTKVTPTLFTVINPRANVTAGTEVYDAAGFSVYHPTGGTVTFNYYSGPGCTGQQTQLNTVNVVPNFVGQSDFVTPTAPGTYSFQATFSGDPGDNPTTSECETLTVTPASSSSQTTTTTPTTGTTSPGNDLLLVGAGVVILIAAGAGYAIVRRRQAGGKAPPTTEKPPPPPPPPPPPRPPTLVAAPPLVTKKPCPDGWVPKKDTACGDTVTLVVFAQPSVEVEGAYQATEEDIEQAIKGLERFLGVAGIAGKVQGALTEPAEFVSSQIEGVTVDKAAEAAIDGLKKLAKAREKLNQVGWAKITYPRETFRFQCIVTRECRDGDWVVTDREFVFERGGPGTPPTATFEVPEMVIDLEKELPQILGQARSWAKIQNSEAYQKINRCRDTCGRIALGSTWQPGSPPRTQSR